MGVTATLLIEPPRVQLPLVADHRFSRVRDVNRYDDFLAQMVQQTSARLSIAEAFLREAPASGMLLLHPSTSLAETLDECPPVLRASLSRRIVLLDMHPARVPELLERHRLAGGIDRRRYFRWTAHPEQEYGGGLYGLKTVATKLQASCAAAPDEQSATYCRIERSPYSDLPALVAAYLEAYRT